MTLSVRREYSLDAIAAAGGAPPSDVLQLANAGTPLQSVTVDNSSNATIALFFDRAALGAPSATVPAQFFKTLPVVAQRIALAVQPVLGQPMRGGVYVEATTEKLTAAGGASPNAQLGTATWDYVAYDGGSTYAA